MSVAGKKVPWCYWRLCVEPRFYPIQQYWGGIKALLTGNKAVHSRMSVGTIEVSGNSSPTQQRGPASTVPTIT